MSSSHFPVDILYNILGRLPVKDIIRLRCVCKAWRDLVVDTEFISTHLNLQTDSGRCLLHYKRCFLHYETDDRDGREKEYFFVFHHRNFAEHSKFEVPFRCDPKFFRMVGSVNGLLCLSPFFRQFGRTLYLWNPSIWKLKILDDFYFQHQFDRRKTRSAVRFYHKTKDYKIVRIMYFHDIYRAYVEKEPPMVEVFSPTRNSWREVGTYAGCCVRDDCSTVVVNGCVHWFAKRTEDASGKFILAFDFGSEKFGEITLPNYIHDGDSQSHGYELEVSVAVLS
ncbi:hypothetical protein LWI28_024960 [Acer negundo]|uniref:F-box domain-containing protein n=1 Tax=Acer negundo TaxID=4023 RepID=A0AAD5J144_ACENE|nr:hypothetical protein LWI28_024960 [Acer negundo]